MERKYTYSKLAATLVVVVLGLTTCLNPIGFNPDTGQIEISAEFTDVTSAVIMLHNLSKTVDVTKVTITQPEVPSTLIEFNSRPTALTSKAQYVRPSDKDYKVDIAFYDAKNKADGSGTILVSAPIPKEIYDVYIFRASDGTIVISEEKHDEDPSDTGTPAPDTDPDEGEGSVPGVVLPANRDRMGVFVVMNMTKVQDIDYVEFTAPYPDNSPNYKQFRISAEPRHGDQQSIALTNGSWVTQIAYTLPSTTEQRFTDTKNGVVMPMNDPMSLRTNFLYFYQTNTGRFEVSPIWPPNPNDASPDQNLDPEDFVGDNQGILEIINKSETGKVIYDIMIDNIEYRDVKLAKDDNMRFILAAGHVNVSFRPQNQKNYGLTLPRTILEKKTSTLSYYDNLANADEFPEDLGHGVGLLQINNNANAVAQQVYIVDPDDPIGVKLIIPFSSFTPPSKINYGKTARVAVLGNELFNLENDKIYLIQVELYKTNGIYYTEYYRVIKDEFVVINISEAELSDTKSYGSKVVIRNAIPANAGEVSIDGMQVWNAARPNQKSYYSAAMWEKAGSIFNGKDASIYVVSSPMMPIVQDTVYRADLFISGNGRSAVMTLDFSSDGILFSQTPDTHVRELELTQADLPGELVTPFYPVTNITNIPTEITSMVMQGSSTLVGPGWINLFAANVVPENATYQAITWSKGGSSQSAYIIGPGKTKAGVDVPAGMLVVDEGKANGQSTQITIKATVKNGKGNWGALTDYTQDFTITLKYTEAVPESHLATALESTGMAIIVDEERSLLGRVTILPENASFNGSPITVSNLTFSIISGGTYATVSSGNRITGNTATPASETVKVRATLGSPYSSSSLSTDFEVIVKASGQAHTPITGITGVPGTVDSKVVNNSGWKLVAPGWINLNAAIVNPSNAVTRHVTWSVTGGDSTYIDTAKVTNEGMLVVNKAGAPGTTVNVKVKGTVTGGGVDPNGTTAAQRDFVSSEFTITLTFSEAEKTTEFAKGLTGLNMEMTEGETRSLLGQVTISPATAVLEGVPITAGDLSFSISGGSGATISGTNITGNVAGTVTVTATLAGKYTGGSTITQNFTVRVNAKPSTHVAVTGFANVPTTVESKVLEGSLIAPGWLNLNAVTVNPANATYKNIKWELANTTNADYIDKSMLEEQGILKVIKASSNSITVTIKGTVINGGAGGTANYVSGNYSITLTFKNALDSNKVSQLNTNLSMSLAYNEIQSLLGTVWFTPASPIVNNVAITPAHLTFTVTSGTGNVEINTTNFTIKGVTADSEATIRATLPGQYTTTGSALTKEFKVTVGSASGVVNVSGISQTAITVESTVMPGTTTLISAGWYNLNAITVQPANASKTNIVWTASSPYIDADKLKEGILLVKQGGTSNQTVTLTATVVDGKGNGVNYTQTVTATLTFVAWPYTNQAAAANIIQVNVNATLKIWEGDVKSLLGLIKLGSGGTTYYYRGRAITVNDLEWEIESGGSGKVTINGSDITGVSSGTVRIRPYLSAVINGVKVTVNFWITVQVDKLPSVSKQSKASFWFLFLALQDGIVFVPCTDNDFSDTERQTGVTNKTWAQNDKDFDRTTFLQKHPDAIIGGRSTGMGYTPGVSFEGDPRPMVYPDTGRYYVFFLKEEKGKSDMRVYGNGPAKPNENKLFLLDLNARDPSITLKPTTGNVSNTAMYTDLIRWDSNAISTPANSSFVPDSDATLQERANTYFNNMGIPIGIYRFRYWNDKITFQAGTFMN